MSQPFLIQTSSLQGTVTDRRPQLSEQMQNSSGSFELVLSAVMLGLAGYFLDGWAGTRPVFMILFTVLGFFGAAASVYYRYKHDIAVLNAETTSLKQQTVANRAAGNQATAEQKRTR